MLLTPSNGQCDTFSRSSDAVFELSMRFAEPFTQAGKSPEAKLEAERLMFLELTQGSQLFRMLKIRLYSSTIIAPSLSLGEFHRPLTTHQHDRGPNQVPSVHWWRSPRCNREEHSWEPPPSALGCCQGSS